VKICPEKPFPFFRAFIPFMRFHAAESAPTRRHVEA
jgi:hypothetical protein